MDVFARKIFTRKCALLLFMIKKSIIVQKKMIIRKEMRRSLLKIVLANLLLIKLFGLAFKPKDQQNLITK